MKAEFYLNDGVLYFKQEMPAYRGTANVVEVYDQKATDQHIRNYPLAYQKYFKSLETVVEVKEVVQEEVTEEVTEEKQEL